MALAPRWLRARTGVRVASALSAAAVVALALMVGGGALILLVGHSLSRSVQDDAVLQAQAIATRMHGNYGKRVDGQFTPKENAVEAIDTLVGSGDPAVAQIAVDYSDDQDGSGWALQTGSDSAAAGPMSDLTPDPDKTVVVPSVLVPEAGSTPMHAVLVAVGGATTTDDPLHFVVLYAAPLAAVDAAQNTVMYYLLFGVPILIIVAGAATYVFAGRALRPVEAIRARVASMSEKDLAQRVPVPVARDEVGRLAETMNAMIARLEDAQGVQRRFVADASHELRSPLATIGAGLELLQHREPETVKALQGETERLGRLVDDLLLLARADERGMRPRQDEVDLDEIVEAEHARPPAGEVHTEVHSEHVRVIGDRGQLVRVLRNLVDNAHRHARSSVVVTLARANDKAALDVVDDGPGVPVADRIRIFERFVRLDDARARADGGSGLGLAIVAEVVAAHNGTVWVDDAPNGGAAFRVRLPAAELPADDDLAVDDEPAAAAAPRGQAGDRATVGAHDPVGGRAMVGAHDPAGGRAMVGAHDPERVAATVAAHDRTGDGATVAAHDRTGDGATVAAHDRTGDGATVDARRRASDQATVGARDRAGDAARVAGRDPAGVAPAVARALARPAAQRGATAPARLTTERGAEAPALPTDQDHDARIWSRNGAPTPGAGRPSHDSPAHDGPAHDGPAAAPAPGRNGGPVSPRSRVARREPLDWAASGAWHDPDESDWVPPQPPEHPATARAHATTPSPAPARAPSTRPLPVIAADEGWRSRVAHALRPGRPDSADNAPQPAVPAAVPVEARADQPDSAIR